MIFCVSAVFAVCCIIELLRQMLFGRLFDVTASHISNVLLQLFEKHMISIKSKKAGILQLNVDVDEYVQKIRHLPEFMILIRIQ